MEEQRSYHTTLRRIQDNLEACIFGKTKEIKLLLTALIAGGHVILEDVPGTGKTVLIKALGKSIQGQFSRIQCNPDLLPSDITGVSIFHPKEQAFVFRPGPILTNILLIDELNRATTKTQSALLEAMEEGHVTVDGVRYDLPRPFLLLATQNPIDFEGTYSLPEAQLDRFMIKFSLGYPDEHTEKQMIIRQAEHHPIDHLEAVTTTQDILNIQRQAKMTYLSDEVMDYIVQLVRKSREHPLLTLGASPRATLSLVSAAKAYALIQGDAFVTPDHVKQLAPYVLQHRFILNVEARFDGVTADEVLQDIFQTIKVPVK